MRRYTKKASRNGARKPKTAQDNRATQNSSSVKKEDAGGGQLWFGRVVLVQEAGGKRKHGIGSSAPGAPKNAARKRPKVTPASREATRAAAKAAELHTNKGSDAAAHAAAAAVVRLQHTRQLLWAQLNAAAAAASQGSNVEGGTGRRTPDSIATNALTDTCSGSGAAAATSTPAGDHAHAHADADTTTNKRRVNLTVHWQARTRIRSGLQPPSVKSVTVHVDAGEISARFISRMVQMAPGGAFDDTQLRWGRGGRNIPLELPKMLMPYSRLSA